MHKTLIKSENDLNEIFNDWKVANYVFTKYYPENSEYPCLLIHNLQDGESPSFF